MDKRDLTNRLRKLEIMLTQYAAQKEKHQKEFERIRAELSRIDDEIDEMNKEFIVLVTELIKNK